MSMNLISVATSKWGPSWAMVICRVLPCKLVYRLAGWLSSYLARQRDIPFVQALYINMAVVHRLSDEDPEVIQIVTRLLNNMLCSYADLFRAVSSGLKEIHAACVFDPSARKLIEECAASG